MISLFYTCNLDLKQDAGVIVFPQLHSEVPQSVFSVGQPLHCHLLTLSLSDLLALALVLSPIGDDESKSSWDLV